MTRILITGASGMLGRHVFEKFKADDRYRIYTVSRHGFGHEDHIIADLAKPAQLEEALVKCQPEVVINCAAYTNLSFCEQNQAETAALHQEAVAGIAKFPSVKKLYYVSTDSVFDGQKGNYTELDEPNPLNYYAKSKYLGELEALTHSKKGYVIRTNILGYKSASGNSLFEWAYKSLAAATQIKGFDNVYFNPLYVGNLAKMILSFVNKEADGGIYNFGSAPAISKYQFLLKVADVAGFEKNLITAVSLDNSAGDLVRPLNTTLDLEKITRSGISVPGIDECINQLYRDFINGTNF